jgi:hypothetical protein
MAVEPMHHLFSLTGGSPAPPPAPGVSDGWPDRRDKTGLGKATLLIQEHFRFPKDALSLTVAPGLSREPGFFRFNGDTICFGQHSSGAPASSAIDVPNLAPEHLKVNGASIQLPFDPEQIVDNLRLEKYAVDSNRCKRGLKVNPIVRDIYYRLRPFMPLIVRKRLQRAYFRGWDKAFFPKWPVDFTVERVFEYVLSFAMKSQKLSKIPFIWFWPDGARNCAILTHDVETSAGVKFCPKLMDLNDSFGLKASFQVVPEERYAVPISFLENIRKRGFEVNVHDLDHDGQLFSDRTEFLRRAQRINRYGKDWGALGFRSAVLYRNPEWFDALDFDYEMSLPNVAHLDPQRGGCCTVFPFFIGNMVELPVTMTQDYSLFHVLDEYSTRLWREQVSLISAKDGLMNFIIHPDYIIPQKAQSVYSELLLLLSELRSQGKTWIPLPREVAAWWRTRSKMNLVNEGGSYRIEGEGSERARMAYAVVSGDGISYEID